MAVAEIVNLYVDDDRRTLVVHEVKDGKRGVRKARAEYVTWHRRADFSRAMFQQLRALPIFRGMREEAEWLRVEWIDDAGRRQGRYGMRDNGIETFEGDVDPALLYLVESGAKIAPPRRCYLDVEADSSVPLSRKEEMRILSWAVVDHETGKVVSALLEEDTDRSEKKLLEELARALDAYDQICVWEGNWAGGEFDSVVVPARWRQRGVDVDERRWIWTNQLAVWKRHSSAESGAEGSMKLDVIAHEQLGEGKEKVPAFVVERFGAQACRHGLGRMTRELWDAGGKFRDFLLEYNEKDAVLLLRLEQEKGFVGLARALSAVCNLHPEDRSMDPTRLMDGYMLRLGRKVGRRFATRERFEKDEMPKKFKGAVVFPPRVVANRKPSEGEEPWTEEDARRWRQEHGFKNGILRNVHVCDFTGMYPNIMRTFNLGPEVVVGRAKRPEDLKPDQCMSPGTGLVTRTDVVALITFAFADLAAQRKHWQDLAATLPPGTPEWINAMAMSNAFKVAMNSFYGAGGTPFSRFYNRDVSESTTQNAVHFLKLVAAGAEARDFLLIYGDTDSTYVHGPTMGAFSKFVSWLNAKRFPEEVRRYGAKENHVKIAYEKSYSRLVIVSKKRYIASYEHYKFSTTCNLCTVEKKGRKNPGSVDVRTLKCRDCGHQYDEIPRFIGKPEIKGIAFKRGDTGPLTRELQARAIDLLVGGLKLKDDAGEEVPANPGVETPTEDVAVYRQIVEEYRDRCLARELRLEDVVIGKGISKSLREFAKDKSDAHVRVARVLQERGQKVSRGMRIEYVVVDASVSPQIVIPAEDFAGECDRYHLWEQTWAPTRDLLEAAFPDEPWGEWDAARPRKQQKGKKKAAPEEQLGLSLAAPATRETRLRAEDELAVPVYRSAPIRVEVPEGSGADAVERVKAVLERFPGARKVRIAILLKSGLEAEVRCDLRVSPGPRLRAAVDEALRTETRVSEKRA